MILYHKNVNRSISFSYESVEKFIEIRYNILVDKQEFDDASSTEIAEFSESTIVTVFEVQQSAYKSLHGKHRDDH